MSQKKQWWNLKKFQHHQPKGSEDKFSGIRILRSSKVLLKILCSGTKILQFLGYKSLLLLGKKFPLPLIGYSKPLHFATEASPTFLQQHQISSSVLQQQLPRYFYMIVVNFIQFVK